MNDVRVFTPIRNFGGREPRSGYVWRFDPLARSMARRFIWAGNLSTGCPHFGPENTVGFYAVAGSIRAAKVHGTLQNVEELEVLFDYALEITGTAPQDTLP